MVHFGPFWPKEVHFGPFRSANRTLVTPESADKKFVRARGPQNWNPEVFDQTMCSRTFACKICPEWQRICQGRSVREKSVRANDPLKWRNEGGIFLEQPFGRYCAASWKMAKKMYRQTENREAPTVGPFARQFWDPPLSGATVHFVHPLFLWKMHRKWIRLGFGCGFLLASFQLLLPENSLVQGEMGAFGPRSPLFQQLGIRAPVWHGGKSQILGWKNSSSLRFRGAPFPWSSRTYNLLEKEGCSFFAHNWKLPTLHSDRKKKTRKLWR